MKANIHGIFSKQSLGVDRKMLSLKSGSINNVNWTKGIQYAALLGASLYIAKRAIFSPVVKFSGYIRYQCFLKMKLKMCFHEDLLSLFWKFFMARRLV